MYLGWIVATSIVDVIGSGGHATQSSGTWPSVQVMYVGVLPSIGHRSIRSWIGIVGQILIQVHGVAGLIALESRVLVESGGENEFHERDWYRGRSTRDYTRGKRDFTETTRRRTSVPLIEVALLWQRDAKTSHKHWNSMFFINFFTWTMTIFSTTTEMAARNGILKTRNRMSNFLENFQIMIF